MAQTPTSSILTHIHSLSDGEWHIDGWPHLTDGKRARPYDTVEPLAEDLGLTVDTSCDRDDPGCVKDVVEGYNGSGNILICWEHDALTDIVEKLGDRDALRIQMTGESTKLGRHLANIVLTLS
jgi:hypothetical protein